MVPFMSQMGLLKKLVLDTNTENHIIAYKMTELDIK